MTHIAGFERDQLLLLPEAVDDYVEVDNPVRFPQQPDDFDIALGFPLQARSPFRNAPRASRKEIGCLSKRAAFQPLTPLGACWLTGP